MNDPGFQLKNPSITIGTECAMCFISVLGLFLNLLALYITLFRIRAKNISIRFMTIISAVDILIAMLVISTQISKLAISHQIINNQLFCQYSGMLFMLLTMTSVDGASILSLIRALALFTKIKINSIYWYIAMGLMFIFNTVFNVFGVIHQIMQVMPSEVYCQAAFRANEFSRLYSIALMTKFTIMLTILMVSYLCITIKYCKAVSKMNSRDDFHIECFVGSTPAIVFQRRVIARLLALVLLYMTSFLPEIVAIIYNITTNTDRDPILDAICGTTMNLAILVNSLFVLLYHKETLGFLVTLFPSWKSLQTQLQSYRIEQSLI